MIPRLIYDAEKNYNGRNITRCYYIVNPKPNGEARIDVWAVKRNKRNQVVAKTIIQWHTDREEYRERDVLRHCTCHFLSVNWAEKSWGKKHLSVFQDVDAISHKWCWHKLKFNSDFNSHFINGTWLNGLEGTKYEKCGWEHSYLHFMQYIQCWNVSHATEFLAKGNLQQFISPSFVKKLRDDKEFFNYFRSSIQQIKNGYYGKGAVLRAFRTGETLNEADTFLKNCMWFAGCGCRNIQKEVDKKELFKWLNGDPNKLDQYDFYCDSVRVVGADITAHGMMFPTSRTMDIINEQAQIVRERKRFEENKARRKEYLKKMREEKKKWERIQQAIRRMEETDYLSRLSIVFPKTQEEYKAEGKCMNNCIGSIYRANLRDNIIGFIRKDGKPYADFRICAETMKLAEVRYSDNKDATEEFGDLVSELASKIEKDINKQERKVA